MFLLTLLPCPNRDITSINQHDERENPGVLPMEGAECMIYLKITVDYNFFAHDAHDAHHANDIKKTLW